VQRNLSSIGYVDWFPDTGANQHVTPDLATLTASKPYLGNDNLHVGDGKGLPISHLGHIKIYTSLATRDDNFYLLMWMFGLACAHFD
jgi:hypothetical protein